MYAFIAKQQILYNCKTSPQYRCTEDKDQYIDLLLKYRYTNMGCECACMCMYVCVCMVVATMYSRHEYVVSTATEPHVPDKFVFLQF